MAAGSYPATGLLSRNSRSAGRFMSNRRRMSQLENVLLHQEVRLIGMRPSRPAAGRASSATEIGHRSRRGLLAKAPPGLILSQLETILPKTESPWSLLRCLTASTPHKMGISLPRGMRRNRIKFGSQARNSCQRSAFSHRASFVILIDIFLSHVIPSEQSLIASSQVETQCQGHCVKPKRAVLGPESFT